jgi:hypothetical protein
MAKLIFLIFKVPGTDLTDTGRKNENKYALSLSLEGWILTHQKYLGSYIGVSRLAYICDEQGNGIGSITIVCLDASNM